MDGGAWEAVVHGVVKSRTRLSDFTFILHFHALEKEMATHSSVLARRIPGTGEPGGLLSMGLHRVRHDWSDLAAASIIYPCSPVIKLFSVYEVTLNMPRLHHIRQNAVSPGNLCCQLSEEGAGPWLSMCWTTWGLQAEPTLVCASQSLWFLPEQLGIKLSFPLLSLISKTYFHNQEPY